MKRSFSIPTTLQSFILFKIVRLTEDAKEILANMSTLLTIHINCFWQMSLWMTKGYIGEFSFSPNMYSKTLFSKISSVYFTVAWPRMVLVMPQHVDW